jgi:glycine/D-amino acid oxidase-like deaminating enzyme
MLPQIDATVQSIWMGRRPSMPDSLPVLSRAPDLICTGRALDLSPYRADRFA